MVRRTKPSTFFVGLLVCLSLPAAQAVGREADVVELKALDRHGGLALLADSEASQVVFSPDGSRLVSGGGADGSLILWDVATGKAVAKLLQAGSRVAELAWSPDGARIAGATLSRTLSVWNAKSGKLEFERKGHGASVCAVAWSPDGEALATVDIDGDLFLGSLHAARKINKGKAACAVAFSPDGRSLAAACKKGVCLYAVNSGRRCKRWLRTGNEVWDLAFLPDGKSIVVAGMDSKGHGVLKRYKTSTGKRMQSSSADLGRVNKLALSKAGDHVVTGSGDGLVTIFASASLKPLRSMKPGPSALWSVDVSPDGELIAAAGNHRRIVLHRLKDGGRVFEVPVHQDRIVQVAYSPDGSLLASGDVEGHVVLRRRKDGKIHARLADFGAYLTTLTFSPDGKQLLTVIKGKARLWADPSSQAFGKEMRPTSVALSPDGKQLVAARWDQSAKIFDTRSGKQIRELDGILHADWSADGRLIATHSDSISKGGTELRIAIFAAADGDKLLTIEDSGTFAFSPSGKTLVAVDAKGIRVYECHTGKLLAKAVTPNHQPAAFAYSPDGKRLATGGGDAVVVEWDLSAY